MPARFEPAENDPRLNAVLIQADPHTGRALTIQRLQLRGA
jgi:calcineurin-like phosphoesterase